MKEKVSTILQTPMDRMSFLKHIGLSAIMFLGVTKFVDSLHSVTGTQSPSYGETDYGK